MLKLARWLVPATLVTLLVGVTSAHAATTYTVNTTADNAPSGTECLGVAGDCSLRQALDKAGDGDTVFLPASTTPYSVSAGKITIPGGVTVQGDDASTTTVSGGGTSQLFEIDGNTPITIESVTLTDGFNAGPGDESGTIENNGAAVDLTLDSVVIQNGHSDSGFGGALEAGGTFTIRHSAFIDNTASLALNGGGAIDFYGSSQVTISDSVFQDNSQVSNGAQGGAILLEGGNGTMTITSSTFTGNSAPGTNASGGALFLDGTSTTTIENSTFSGNSAAGSGGAIQGTDDTSLTFLNDTFSGNDSPVGATVDNPGSGASTSAQNTIFAAAGGGGTSCSTPLTASGHDLDDSSANSCLLSAAQGDLIGVNPALAALADNSTQGSTAGGPPQTMALPATSPAVGAGDATVCGTLGNVDERGFPRPGIPGRPCDIGAFEAPGTSTSVAASSTNPALHQPVTITAAISAPSLPGGLPAPSGTVTFRDGAAVLGTVPLGSNRASLTTAALAGGAHAITATYSGDGVYFGSTSPGVAVTVTVTVKPPRPSISRLRESHKVWRLGSKHARLARKVPVGTTFSFRLNTASKLRLTFRRLSGRHRGKAAGTLSFKNAAAGQRKLRFQGRLKGRRKLAPGRYSMTLTASNATGSSRRTVRFRIVRG